MASLTELVAKLGLDVKGFHSGVGDAIGAAEGLNNRFSTIAASISTVFVGALTGIGFAALSAGKTFDDASDTIRIGTGKTGKALQELEGSFKTVFANVPASAASVSTAIADLNTRLGLSGKPLEDLTTQMLNLARITKTDVGPLIADTTRVFGDWAIATEDQSNALDFLFRASQSTGIGVSQLSQRIVQFGAPLRQMGFDFETSAALLGKFEKEGVNTELVMGSLRIALTRMAKEGVTDAKEGLESIVKDIKNAGSAGEANALALATFGSRAGPDMAAAIREGRFEIGNLLTDLKASGETINTAASETDDFAESWTLFKNRLVLALEPLGTTLLRVLDTLVQKMEPVIGAVAGAVDWFSKLDPGIQAAAVAITGVVGSLGLLLPALGAAASSVTALTGILGGAAGLTGLLTLAGPLAIALGAAIAGWAIYEAVSQVSSLNKELDRLYELQARGVKATSAQAEEVRVLESVLKKQRVEVDATGLSVEQYIQALRNAAKNLDEFKGASEKVAKVTKDGAINISDAAEAYLGLGKATVKVEKAIVAHGKATAKSTKDTKDHEKAAIRAAAASIEMSERYERVARVVVEAGKKIVAMDEDIERQTRQLSQTFGKAHESIRDEATKTVNVLVPLSARIPTSIHEAIKANKELAEAYKDLGITSTETLTQQAASAEQSYEKIKNAGSASARDIETAWIRMEKARVAAAESAGESIPAEYKRSLEKMEVALSENTKKQATIWDGLSKQVSTIITDLSRNIADTLFSGEGSFGSRMLGILKDIGKAFTRTFIEIGINAIKSFITDGVDGALNAIKGLSGALGGIFGGSGSAAGGVASTAGGAARSGGAAGSVAGAGISSTIGAVASVGSLATDIIGVFQSMGMNKSLDILVKHTLQMVMIGEATFDLIDNRLGSIHDRWLQFLDSHAWRVHDIWQVNTDILATVREMRADQTGRGGEVHVTVNVAGTVTTERDLKRSIQEGIAAMLRDQVRFA